MLLTVAAPGAAGAKPRPNKALAHAHEVISAISTHATAVRTELRFARRRDDRPRVQCLSNKLSELHAQQRQANVRQAELVRALERGDRDKVLENRVVLASLQSRARELFRQAQRCSV
jgi:hypothetical protein